MLSMAGCDGCFDHVTGEDSRAGVSRDFTARQDAQINMA